jgi:hypothetical protein
MAANFIKVLDAYVRHFESAAKAPLTRITNQQALTVFKSLLVIDGLHTRLRQSVQNIQRRKKKKVERLLGRTPSHWIIKGNLRRIYRLKSGASDSSSQIATCLLSSHPKVVRRWIMTVPVAEWGSGEMSTEIGETIISKMETMENPDITTEELEVLKNEYKSDLQESQDYMDYYSILLLLMVEPVDLTE